MKTRSLATLTSLLLLVTACAELGAQIDVGSTETKKVAETKAEAKTAGEKSQIRSSKVEKTLVWQKTLWWSKHLSSGSPWRSSSRQIISTGRLPPLK